MMVNVRCALPTCSPTGGGDGEAELAIDKKLVGLCWAMRHAPCLHAAAQVLGLVQATHHALHGPKD